MNDSPYLFAYPLFGATISDDRAIGPARLAATNWKQWSDFDTRDVVEEQAGAALWASRLGIEGAMKPPPILTMHGDTLDHFEVADRSVEVIVIGLRLVGAAGFLDPKLAVRVAMLPPEKRRYVGLYQMYGYSLLVDPPDHIDAAMAAEVEQLGDLMVSRDAVTVLRPLRAVFAPAMSSAAKAALALPMLEGVYGRMNRKFGGLYFGERLRSVGVADDLVDWMESREPGAGRDTRNSLAHGRSVSPESVERLLDLLLAALVAFLRTDTTAEATSPVDRFRRTVWV